MGAAASSKKYMIDEIRAASPEDLAQACADLSTSARRKAMELLEAAAKDAAPTAPKPAAGEMADEKANPFTVLICGGGNAAQVASAMFAQRYECIAISFFADEAERWKAAIPESGMSLKLDTGKTLTGSHPADVTNDASVAAKADVIILAVPSFAHEEYFTKLGPHMKPGTVVAAMPARSGGDILFSKCLGAKASEMTFVGFETLPWACRFTEWGQSATILGTKQSILAAVTPASQAAKSIGYLQGLFGVFPQITKSPNNLGISLRNPGQVIHPGVMYGRWSPEAGWDGKPVAEKPLFYQGVDEFTAGVLTGISDEVQATARKMESLVPGLDLGDAATIYDWYMACYSDQIEDSSTLKLAMNTCKAYVGLTHPCKEEGGGFMPDLKYRYLSEDVPTGLCFSKGLAEILEVPTPTMDKVMMWAQECIGLEIMVDGKMCGKDIAKTRAPQGMGITTADDFIAKAQLA
jgi:hypothetical protein